MSTANGKKRLADEISHLKHLMEEDPESAEFYRLADAYSRAGRFMDAIKTCKEGLKHHPRLLSGHVALGRSLFGAGKLIGATKVLRKALNFRGCNTEPYRLLGEVLLRREAPSEAVRVLERAEEQGITDRAIRNLLERARIALDQEKTTIVGLAPEIPRGIGNVAVAGVIGATSEIDVAEEADESLAKTSSFECSDDGYKTSPHLKRLDQQQKKDWSSIDDCWEQELDARSDGSFPDVGSDVGGPFDHSPRVELSLSPLVDPLTEGIPPLPMDSDDSGMLEVPPDLSIASTTESADEILVDRVIAESADKTLIERVDAEPITKIQGIEKNKPAIAPAHGLDSDSPVGHISEIRTDPEPPEFPDDTDDDHEEPITTVVLPEVDEEKTTPGLTPTSISSSSSSMDQRPMIEQDKGRRELPKSGLGSLLRTPGIMDLGIPNLEQSIDYTEKIYDMEPGVREGRRNTLWIILVFIFFAGGSGAGIYGWHLFQQGKKRDNILRLSRKAKQQGTLDGYKKAIQIIDSAQSKGIKEPQVLAEGALLQSLFWYRYGMGALPSLKPSTKPWSHLAARAVIELAGNKPRRALELLKSLPRQKRDRHLALLIQSWAMWLIGDRQSALAKLERIQGTKLADRDLLLGHLHRESGELDKAEAAYRAVLEQSPAHQLAKLALAAVLLEREASQSEVKKLLAFGPRGPVVQAWHSLLKKEQQLRQGVQLFKNEPTLPMATTRAALLYQSARTSLLAGCYISTTAALKRLSAIRKEGDQVLEHLFAERDLMVGLPAKVIQRLKDKQLTPRGRRILVAAFLHSDKPAKALKLLSGVRDEPFSSIFELVARALLDHKSSLAALEKKAHSSRLAQLWFARLLIKRGKQSAALAQLKDFAQRPLFRLPVRTLQATALLEKNKLGQALDTLSPIIRDSPWYLPAKELLGMIYLRLGRYKESAQVLHAVEKAGRGGPQLGGYIARAQALAGDLVHAREKLDGLKTQRNLPADQIRVIEGLIAASSGSYQQAIKLLSQASEGDLNAQLSLGQAYLEVGNLSAARQIFTTEKKKHPSHPLPDLWLGEVKLDRFDPKAEEHFRKAIQQARKHKYFPRSIISDGYVGIANVFLRKNKSSSKILTQLKKAIRLDPANGEAHRMLGEIYIKQQRFRQARAALRRCITLDSTDTMAFYLLGTSSRSPIPQARKALLRFLELEPKGPRAKVAKQKLRILK